MKVQYKTFVNSTELVGRTHTFREQRGSSTDLYSLVLSEG